MQALQLVSVDQVLASTVYAPTTRNSASAEIINFKNSNKSAANGIRSMEGLPACLDFGEALLRASIEPIVGVRIGVGHRVDSKAASIDADATLALVPRHAIVSLACRRTPTIIHGMKSIGMRCVRPRVDAAGLLRADQRPRRTSANHAESTISPSSAGGRTSDLAIHQLFMTR